MTIVEVGLLFLKETAIGQENLAQLERAASAMDRPAKALLH
jgi:hypothetical protein